MANTKIMRLSISAVIILGSFVSLCPQETAAQNVPPPLPPPTLNSPRGVKTPAEQPGNNQENKSNQEPNIPAKKSPKFAELLERNGLQNFRGYESNAIGPGWKLEGKILHYDGSSIGDIITKTEYSDFELQFDYRITEGASSGVAYRVSLGDVKPIQSGPEFQIVDDPAHVEGKDPITTTGAVSGLFAPKNRKTRAPGSWNAVRIIVEGNRIQHYLNSIKVVDVEIGSSDWIRGVNDSRFKNESRFAKNSRGHIAFLENGDEIWFRKIRIKDLSKNVASNPPPARYADPQPQNTPKRYAKPQRNTKPRFYNESIKLKNDQGGNSDKGSGN